MPTTSGEEGGGIPSEIQAECLHALRRGASVRRSVGPLSRIRESLDVVTFPLIGGLLQSWASVTDAVGAILRLSTSKWGLWARPTQLQYASSAAQRAEWNSRFATALRHLSNARRRYRRIVAKRLPNDAVDRILDQRQWAAAESFADFLAVTWRLSHAATGDLRELIRRLATQHGPAAQKTQALLGHLETVLLEGRATYYRISVRTWLAKGKSGGRLRQVLPFQGTLKSLAALEAATVLLLPGIFGFLFWELKENWGLYGNNRAEPVPQARLGSHGETLNGMLRRGFHSGTIPKAFDRLREVLDDQIRREAPGPRQLRRALAPLAQIDAMISRFGEQELAGPLRDACPEGLVTKTESRIASRGVELRAGLHSADGVESVELSLKLTMRGTALVCTPSLTGPVRQLSAF